MSTPDSKQPWSPAVSTGFGIFPVAFLGNRQRGSFASILSQGSIDATAPEPAPQPAASSRPRPKAKAPPPRPPFRAHRLGKVAADGAGAELPNFFGPRPSKDWKADRVVNWQPIRQAERLEGSVWQHVRASIENGLECVPEGLFDGLNSAFMCKADSSRRVAKRTSRKPQVERRLPQNKALQVDVLHAQLSRCGIQSSQELSWITGCEGVAGWLESNRLDVKILDTLLEMLRAVEGYEGSMLCDIEETVLAPSEAFLAELQQHAGPIAVLRGRIETVVNMERFAERVQLESDLAKCLATVHSVMDSRALPVLLEGVLLVGNYVNSSSKALGGAVGITLDSLAKLAHTRGKGESQGHSVVHILTGHLQQTHPSFLEKLEADLKGCSATQDIDPKAIAEQVKELSAQIQAVEDMAGSADPTKALPPALHPERLRNFLDEALPKLRHLRGLVQEVDRATSALRRWFAEPSSSRYGDMMRSLGALHGSLPKPAQLQALRSTKSDRTGRRSRLSRGSGFAARQESSESQEPCVRSLASTESPAPSIAGDDVLSSSRDPESEFEAPLNELRMALAQMQGANSAREQDIDEIDDFDGLDDPFAAPLADLRSVLAFLKPQATVLDDAQEDETRECESEAFQQSPTSATTRTDVHWGSQSGRSDAEDATPTVSEDVYENFKQPLADLQEVVSRLKSTGVETASVGDEGCEKRFEAPLMNLRQVLSQLRPTPSEAH